MGIISDVPVTANTREQYSRMIFNSTKPHVVVADNAEDLEDIFRMYIAVRGSAEALRLKPYGRRLQRADLAAAPLVRSYRQAHSLREIRRADELRGGRHGGGDDARLSGRDDSAEQRRVPHGDAHTPARGPRRALRLRLRQLADGYAHAPVLLRAARRDTDSERHVRDGALLQPALLGRGGQRLLEDVRRAGDRGGDAVHPDGGAPGLQHHARRGISGLRPQHLARAARHIGRHNSARQRGDGRRRGQRGDARGGRDKARGIQRQLPARSLNAQIGEGRLAQRPRRLHDLRELDRRRLVVDGAARAREGEEAHRGAQAEGARPRGEETDRGNRPQGVLKNMSCQ